MWECEAGPGEAPPTGSGVSNLSNVSITIQPIVASCCALISADLSEVELLMGNKGNISVYALLLPQISLLCSVCVTQCVSLSVCHSACVTRRVSLGVCPPQRLQSFTRQI